MRWKILTACLVFVVCALCFTAAMPAQEKPEPKREKFSALAYMPSGAGPAMVGAGARVNIDMNIQGYTSDADAKVMADALVQGGPDALLKLLEKADSIGKITLTGRVGFYDLKLIRSHRTQTGRRIYAVGDRPVGFLEAYVQNRSMDYPFGILQIDLETKENGKEEGSGALIYAAKIKVLEGNSIDVESYGIQPIRLMGVRKL